MYPINTLFSEKIMDLQFILFFYDYYIRYFWTQPLEI